MYLAAGGPIIRRDPISVDERIPSFEEYVGTSPRETYSLNPTQQFGAIGRLKELEPISEELTFDEFGQETRIRRGALDPSDPRARRLSLDEANERGKDIGLRFSEPPTQGQFDYLSELKLAENERASVLAQAPGAGAWLTARVADLAASAIDPLNIASAFVPVIGEARYARMVSRFGVGRARLAKGAAEGFVGTALVTPLVYSQAQTLQQNYDMTSVMADLAVGTVLGSGLHWAGGKVLDIYRGENLGAVGRLIGRNSPETPGPVPRDPRRSATMPEGENAARAAAMDVETRRSVMNATLKAVTNDVEPRVNEIFKGSPELADLGMPDKRFPATLRLRAPLTAADYARGTRASRIIDSVTEASVKRGQPVAPALMKAFTRRYGKLGEVALAEMTPQEFSAAARNLIEHPEQRAVYDPESGRLLVTEGASPGAIRHEIERALDELYGHTGDGAGGYRFTRQDAEGPVAFRQAIKALYEDEPGRAPRAERTGEDAVELFSRRGGDIMNVNGQKVADHTWNVVQEGKDKDLDTRIKEEELEVIEELARVNQGAVRDLGILEKVIPAEERAILDQAAANQSHQSAQRDLFRAMDEAADGVEVNQTLRDAEMLMAAGPDRHGAIIRGEMTEGQVIKQMEDDGFVTRDQALRSIRIYTTGLKDAEGNAITLSGERLEQAVKLVKAGEDIDVAVKAATEGGELLAAAQKALDEAETRFEVPGEEDLDLESDLVALATKILDDGQITSTRELAEYEGRVVAEEQARLEENPATKELSDDLERVEFDEANRNRALREGASPAERRARAGEQLRREGRPLEDGLFATSTGRDGAPARGAGNVIERERGASGGERAAPETVTSYGGWTVPRRVITPDSSIEVSVEPRIVELEDLIHAEGSLQVRDRSRKELVAEARERALKLDPEQMLPNRVADSGAPIVVHNPNGKYTIISGNGRTMSLRQVYNDETLGWKAQSYRERLGQAADGYRRPVLVSVITDELTDGDLIRFAERANRSRISEMSVTEKAQRDADVAGHEIMSLYQGGEFTKRENQAFLRAFMRKVATPQELGEMSKNGVLSKPGVDRLNAAVLASAYDDTGVLSLMLESADLNIKTIANAYRDVAPAFMKLRAEIAQGLVREEMDITAYMMEAARFVSKAREEGTQIGNALAQIDVLSPIDPVVEALVRQFYNPQLTRANSSLRIAEVLKRYTDIASEKRTGGFFEDTTGARDVLGAAQRGIEEGAGTPPPRPGFTRLYRVDVDPKFRKELPDYVRLGQQESGFADASGRWFVQDKSLLDFYLDDTGRDRARVIYIDIKNSDVDKYRVSNSSEQLGNRTVKSFSRDPDNEFFLPKDMAGRAEKFYGDLDEAEAILGADEAVAGASPEAVGRSASEPAPQESRAGDPEPSEGASPAAADRPAVEAGDLESLTVKQLRERAKAEKVPLAGKTRKADIIEALRKPQPAPEPQPRAEPEGMSDEAIDALPDPDELEAVRDRGLINPAQRHAFYDYLEGDGKVSGAGTVAKALKISVDEAGRLIDEGIEAGWLTINSKDQVIRVPVNRRPGRPDDPDALADAPSTPAFKQWFGNSKAVDSSGNPIRVYHGTKAEFSEFRQAEGGIFFSANTILPSSIAERRGGEGGNVIAAYVRIENPAPTYKDFLDNKAYDGYISHETYVVRDPSQVKSAIGNRGTFDPNNLDIAYADAPRGWGWAGEPQETDIVRAMQKGAVDFLARKSGTTADRIVRAFGFKDPHDYVQVAREQGYLPGDAYERMRQDAINAQREASLQATLSIQKAFDRAMSWGRVPEGVQMKIMDEIFHGDWTVAAQFRPLQNLIEVSRKIGNRKPGESVPHELFHATRRAGLFFDNEWAIARREYDIARQAFNEFKTERYSRYHAYYREEWGKMGMEPGERMEAWINDKLVEEWMATEYGKWQDRRDKHYDSASALERIFRRVKDFVDGLYRSFKHWIGKDGGPGDVEEIFKAIEDGSIARRWVEWGKGRSGPDNPLSRSTAALAEMTDDLNTQMRTLAKDDSLSIGTRQAEAVKAFAPCVAHHL